MAAESQVPTVTVTGLVSASGPDTSIHPLSTSGMCRPPRAAVSNCRCLALHLAGGSNCLAGLIRTLGITGSRTARRGLLVGDLAGEDQVNKFCKLPGDGHTGLAGLGLVLGLDPRV